jgi:hypothetical protein
MILGVGGAAHPQMASQLLSALAGLDDLLHTSRGVIPGFPPVLGRQRA